MIKKFDGSGDPHDHVASFKQVVRAEQVSDQHTQIEGFQTYIRRQGSIVVSEPRG